MNTFNVSKRCILSFEQFLKDGKKAQNADHDEKGEADIVKKAMDGEKEGKKGYATLDESKLNEMYGKLLNKDVLSDYLTLEYEIDTKDVISQTYEEIKAAITKVLQKHGFAQYKSEVDELMEAELYEKKFSTEKREELADKGLALPDGSYPIESPADLRNAIKAYGRAKDKEAAKKHIKKRAKALQMTDLIPKDWK